MADEKLPGVGSGGGGGASLPFYPTSHGGIASGRAPRLVIERQLGHVNGNTVVQNIGGPRYYSLREEGGNATYVNLTIEEVLGHVRAWD
jgi:hypothetical protein